MPNAWHSYELKFEAQVVRLQDCFLCPKYATLHSVSDPDKRMQLKQQLQSATQQDTSHWNVVQNLLRKIGTWTTSCWKSSTREHPKAGEGGRRRRRARLDHSMPRSTARRLGGNLARTTALQASEGQIQSCTRQLTHSGSLRRDLPLFHVRHSSGAFPSPRSTDENSAPDKVRAAGPTPTPTSKNRQYERRVA